MGPQVFFFFFLLLSLLSLSLSLSFSLVKEAGSFVGFFVLFFLALPNANWNLACKYPS